MNAHTGNIKYGKEAKSLVAFEDCKKTGAPPAGMEDTPESLAAMSKWDRLTTTLGAKISYTGRGDPQGSVRSKHRTLGH